MVDYAIDWAATGQMISGLGSWAGAFALIYAAYKGSDTFKKWRQQKTEGRRFEIAEDILALGYKMQRNIKAIRSRGILGYETEAATSILEKNVEGFAIKPEAERRRMQTAQVVLNRIKDNSEDIEKIFELMPTAKAFFGDKVSKKIGKIWSLIVDIQVGAESYSEDTGKDQDFSIQLRKDIWGDSSQIDGSCFEINQIVSELEVELLPLLRHEGVVVV